jgi:hypothetical protein
MRKLIGILCLTVAVILGSAGMSASDDFDKDAIALKNLVQRNGVYYKFLSSTPHTGKVLGQKTGYLKYGRWDGDYIEIDESKTYKLSGTYRNGVRIGEWKFSLKKQNATLNIFAKYKNGILKLDEK